MVLSSFFELLKMRGLETMLSSAASTNIHVSAVSKQTSSVLQYKHTQLLYSRNDIETDVGKIQGFNNHKALELCIPGTPAENYHI